MSDRPRLRTVDMHERLSRNGAVAGGSGTLPNRGRPLVAVRPNRQGDRSHRECSSKHTVTRAHAFHRGDVGSMNMPPPPVQSGRS